MFALSFEQAIALELQDNTLVLLSIVTPNAPFHQKRMTI